MLRRAVPAAALALLAAMAGCGLGAGEQQQGGAELHVTRNFGQLRLGAERLERVPEGLTVMRLLQSRREVKTRYGGGFVQAIDGLSGEGPDGRRDWFYFVNGIEGEVGAAEKLVFPGDVVQWDFHRWDAAMRVPAIVGAYPAPFTQATEGRRFPVRLECERPDAPACVEVRERLAALGVPTGTGALGSAAADEAVRVAVGRWPALRSVRPAGTLELGPRRSGVFARFGDRGAALELLDERGRAVRTAPPGTGLVAATADTGQQLLWLVTGIDDAGVRRAAAALDERTLRDRFAVAATPDGPLALPVAGRGGS